MKNIIDWDHYYWRFAERWNGRFAMIGVVGMVIYLTVR
jgi:preprotein translocase subunit Sss1